MTDSFDVLGPEPPRRPVVLSVPHAGRDYPDALLASSRASRAQLQLLEDRHADRLAEAATAAGFTTIVARRARAWIDLNRDPREIDPDMIEPSPATRAALRSARVVNGLGLIPRRLRGCGEILSRKLTGDEVATRIVEDHAPYHARLGALLAAARRAFGCAALLDLHSMPTLAPTGAGAVIGDRFGQSASARFAAAARAAVEAHGCSVAENIPYAGGYLLDAHGAPAQGVHAVQLEVDRALYLDARGREIGPGAENVSTMVRGVAEALADEALGARLAQAAE